MKSLLSFALLAVFALTSCEIDEPPVRRTTSRTTTTARYPSQTTAAQYPPQPQPFPDDVQASAPATTPPLDPAATAATAPTTESAAASAPSGPAPAPKADYPYGVPVPGKPGFVRSPYSPDKMTDVRGYAPGTEVKDPYTQKIFLVP